MNSVSNFNYFADNTFKENVTLYDFYGEFFHFYCYNKIFNPNYILKFFFLDKLLKVVQLKQKRKENNEFILLFNFFDVLSSV